MKNLTLAATFVVLAAGFAVPGYAADDHGAITTASAEITFIGEKTQRTPHISNAIYLTDTTASEQRSQNLLIDVNGKHFKKKFFKRKSFNRGFRGHRSFGHRDFGHRNFGHGGFGHHRSDFGHGGHGGKVYKKGLIGKLLFGH